MFKRKKTYTFFCFFPQMVQKTSHHLFFQKEGKPRKLILLNSYSCTFCFSSLEFCVCSFQHRPPFHHHFRVLHMCCNFQHKQRPCRRHQDLVTNIMDLSEAPEEAKVGKDMNSRDARFEKKCLITVSMFFQGSDINSRLRNILLTGIVVV